MFYYSKVLLLFILQHSNPDSLFTVEVDASSCGIGAMHSQCHGEPAKLYLCAFFSHKLTSAEANYDVGNRKLLEIIEALEEWRHCKPQKHPYLQHPLAHIAYLHIFYQQPPHLPQIHYYPGDHRQFL